MKKLSHKALAHNDQIQLIFQMVMKTII